MKKLKTLIYLSVICFVIYFINGNAIADTNQVTNPTELHNQTKLNYYVDKYPAITILTPGQGGNESHFTNYNGRFAYDEVSIVENMRTGCNSDVYLAEMSSSNTNDATTFKNFTLYLCEKGEQIANTNYYDYELTEVTHIQNYTKHTLIIFAPNFRYEYHSIVYSELESLIDSISYEFKLNTGWLPKINLIGHSRGGLINLMYATNHPYNVCSLISVGTPYAGSALSQIPGLLAGVGLESESSSVTDNHSALDILNVDKQNELRNNWNRMLELYPNANINAIAIGSCTSASFLETLFSAGYVDEYIEESNSNLLRKLKTFMANLSNSGVTSYISEHPEAINSVLRVIDLGIDVSSFFSLDTTAQEMQKIQQVLNNCYLDYGTLMIYDDLFIDYQSQTAVGYNGFVREKKNFFPDNTNYTKTSSPTVPIPHNLETRDDEVMGLILSTMPVYPAASSSGNIILDQTKNISSLGYAVKYTFTPTITTRYKLKCTNTGVNIVIRNQDTDVIEHYIANEQVLLQANVTYDIYVHHSGVNGDGVFSITFPPIDDLMNVDTTLSPNEFIYLKIQYPGNVVKTLNSNNEQIKLELFNSSFESVSDYNSSFMFRYEANTKYYLKVYNITNTTQHIILTQNMSSVITYDETFTTEINYYYKYYKFVAPTTNTFIFELTSLSNSSYEPDVEMYSGSLKALTKTENINTKDKMLYSVPLTAGEIIYIAVRNKINATKQITIDVSVSNYYWVVDGTISSDRTVNMNRSGLDKIRVSYYCNGHQLKGNIKFLAGSLQYFIKSVVVTDYEYELTLKNNANLNLDGNTYLNILYEAYEGDIAFVTQELYISVDPYINIDINDTSDIYDYSVIIDFATSSKLSDESIMVTLQIKNKYNETQIQTFNMSQFYNAIFVPASNNYRVGDLEISVYSVTYTKGNFSKTYSVLTNQDLFDIETDFVIKKGLIQNGDGTEQSPYLITTLRELNNIRQMTAYDHYHEEFYITGIYKLMNNIQCSETWIPITPIFKGDFYGNNKTISNLYMTINNETRNYGLFGSIDNSVIKDLTISNVKVVSGVGPNLVNMGAISGQATDSNLQNCKVTTGNIGENYNNFKSHVGGLVGLSWTTQYIDCISGAPNTTSTDKLALYGYGTIGGITGYMHGGSFTNCYNYANLYYKWDGTNNMYTGGIVGRAISDTTITSCGNYGLIKFNGEKSDSKDLAPYMGQIIGYKEATVQLTGCVCNGSYDYSNLREVGGFLGIGTTNQARYASTGACGYSE